MDRNERRQLIKAARDTTEAMTRCHKAINDIASSSGKLLGLMDNRDQAPVLGTVRGETAFQLVADLGKAYSALADFLAAQGES